MMREALMGAGIVAVLWFAWRRLREGEAVEAFEPPEPIEDGGPEVSLNQMLDAENKNVAAFLDMIAMAEGTSNRGASGGYDVLFGGSLFVGYADHPRVAAQFVDSKGRRLWTSAAGRYQFMAVSSIPGGGATKVDTWDRVRRKLQLKDFSPHAQDAAAIELIREQNALADVRAGRFAVALTKVAKVWASLPGAGYAQPERQMSALRSAYVAAGGVITA